MIIAIGMIILMILPILHIYGENAQTEIDEQYFLMEKNPNINDIAKKDDAIGNMTDSEFYNGINFTDNDKNWRTGRRPPWKNSP